MSEEIANEILKNIVFIPGIIGLATMDFSKSNNSLNENFWYKSLKLKKINNVYELSIAIIIETDINAKMISNEIDMYIRSIFKKNNFKLSNLNIYIRGVK